MAYPPGLRTSPKKKLDDEFTSWKSWGNYEFKKKNFEKAKECYGEAIRLGQDVIHSRSNRAQCHLNLNEYYDALNDCNEVLKLDPKHRKSYYRRAVALRNLYRFELALEDLMRIEGKVRGIKKEIKEVTELAMCTGKIDMVVYPKPEIYRSKEPMSRYRTVPYRKPDYCDWDTVERLHL